MRGIDWEPWLDPDEHIVWQGKKKNRLLALGGLFVLAIFVVVPYFNDGSERIQLAVKASPWIVAFVVISLFFMAFRQSYYAVSNRRAMQLSLTPGRKPKFESVRLDEAEAVKHPKTPLIFLHRQTRKPVVQMWLGQNEAEHVMAMIKRGRP